MALSKTTQDHDEIRKWAEARGAVPSAVESTEKEGEVGIIRLEFPNAPNANDSALREISWDQFFEKFDASGLALVYQDLTAEGEQSNFNRLVHPENAVATPAKSSGAKPSAKRSAPAKTSAKTPAEPTPVKQPPAKKSAAKKAPGKKSVATKAPAKEAPAKTSPSKLPAKKAIAKKAIAKKSPAKKSPAKSPSTKSAQKTAPRSAKAFSKSSRK